MLGREGLAGSAGRRRTSGGSTPFAEEPHIVDVAEWVCPPQHVNMLCVYRRLFKHADAQCTP